MNARGTTLRNLKNEEGQSIIMVTVLVVVWIALIGLVVDIGNAYAQRRHPQIPRLWPRQVSWPAARRPPTAWC